ncbi:MAG TPA: hypothetical protein VK666_30660 [Chryseolinea sp.]|nr:hypothetical protein [Chryseolinea sp.]
MNRITAILLLFCITVSCDDDSPESAVHWETIKIDHGGMVYSIYGDIDDFLIVGTIDKILRTTDGGKTWSEVQRTESSIGSFTEINRVLYAASNFKDYRSDDDGLTWTELEFDWEITQPDVQLEDSRGAIYSFVTHSSGEIGLPITLLRSLDHGNSWQDILPYKIAAANAYLDKSDRLFLGTSGAKWDKDLGSFFSDDPEFPAYIYYTTK